MVANNLAVYDPPKQARSVLLYWRRPEEWADVLHSWVCNLHFLIPYSLIVLRSHRRAK